MYQQYKGDFIITIMFLITYPLKLWCTAALPGGCQGSVSPPLFRLFQALKCEFAVLWITPIFYIQPMTITLVPPILILYFQTPLKKKKKNQLIASVVPSRI